MAGRGTSLEILDTLEIDSWSSLLQSGSRHAKVSS